MRYAKKRLGQIIGELSPKAYRLAQGDYREIQRQVEANHRKRMRRAALSEEEQALIDEYLLLRIKDEFG
jgi:hypothetical protein